MKHYIIAMAALAACTAAQAQTMNVYTGRVVTAVTATPDDMTYTDGGTILNILGKEFAVSDIDSIVVSTDKVEDNTVLVRYDGSEAWVTVAGNVAKNLTTTVVGAYVGIMQDASLEKEITYTLEGSSDDGAFYMDGELKATIVLNGVTLTSKKGAAIDIDNGKRIAVKLAEGTVSTLADAADGKQKACFRVNGHTEFAEGGTLCITGNAKHAFFGDEYVELKKTTGTIKVLASKKDAFNVNQYFLMKGGTVSATGVGDDGIQVSKTDDTDDELNGQVIIKGGKLNLDITAEAAKGIKCDDSLSVSGGEIYITTSGNGTYDNDDADVKGSACMKADASITVSGGTLTLKSTGAGGKGMSADGDINISGGTLSVTTTGQQYVYNNLDTSPKGIKAGGNVNISGGDIEVTATGGEGSEGIESKNIMTIDGGNIVVNTYDDCLNATNNITINGGRIFASASGNDGIDSNGTLTINGGLVIAMGTREPEEGFDCDQNTFTITGGTLIGLGGGSSTPTSSTTTQPVTVTSVSQLNEGRYLTLADSDGNNIFAFRMPRTYSQAKMLVSSPKMSVGSSYSVGTATAATGTGEWQGYIAEASVEGGSNTSTFTQSQTVNTSGNGGGGPGGGGGGRPGGGGGGWGW